MTQKTFKADRYEPDYKNKCDCCGAIPTVTIVNSEGKQIYTTEMCGPCTWGEAETVDPDTWN